LGTMPSLMAANHLLIGITLSYTARMGSQLGMGCLPYIDLRDIHNESI